MQSFQEDRSVFSDDDNISNDDESEDNHEESEDNHDESEDDHDEDAENFHLRRLLSALINVKALEQEICNDRKVGMKKEEVFDARKKHIFKALDDHIRGFLFFFKDFSKLQVYSQMEKTNDHLQEVKESEDDFMYEAYDIHKETLHKKMSPLFHILINKCINKEENRATSELDRYFV